MQLGNNIEIGDNLARILYDALIVTAIIIGLCWTREPGCLLGLIFLR